MLASYPATPYTQFLSCIKNFICALDRLEGGKGTYIHVHVYGFKVVFTFMVCGILEAACM